MTDKTSQSPARGVEVIRRAAAELPRSPGCYLMRDTRGKVIYVGKAKRLKARVSSYTREPEKLGPYGVKVGRMVSQVAAVDFIVTSSEKEALLLENTLIKRHRPRYNVDLRDDKSYPYLRLDTTHAYPRLSLVRRPQGRDGARYFGPFDSAGMARATMKMLQKTFPLRRCTDHAIKSRQRPCLDYETGRCLAPCVGACTDDQYAEAVAGLLSFFQGQGKELARRLRRRMKQAAAEQRFEEAAAYRDRWQALERTLEQQHVSRAGGQDLDVVAIAQDEQGSRLALLAVRHGRVVASRVHDLKEAAWGPAEMMAQGLLQLYDPEGPGAPSLILVSHLPPDPALVVEVLAERSGAKVELRRPQRGDKMGLMRLAQMNAAAPRATDRERRAAALERVGRKLKLPGPPARMECVDISHLGGRLTVASLVSFSEGEPDKSAYRRYQVVGAAGASDDYAAIREVLSRRLARHQGPDLLVVDGGKGQLNIAKAVLDELAPDPQPALAALAKGRGRGPDRVFVPGRKNPVGFTAGDPGLLLLMRLRDEAHRFAIAYHRLLRRKALTKSVLEEVPGVGPKKRQALLKAFGSLKAVKAATAAEMVAAAGLDRATAEAVQAFLAALDSPNPQM